MTQALCPYCAAADGGRCVPAGGGRFITECRSCGRVTEERLTEVEELFVERARDSPLCIVTPDFIDNDKYRAPALEDDPYERIGFITAFSTWSLELTPLLAVTSCSFSGQLAELERVLSDFLYTPGGGGPGGGSGAPTPAGVSVNMVEALRAYYQIVDVTSVLGLEKDSSDHAVQLFRDCSSTTYLRNRNIEALATAALVQASREAQEPRTLQEISAAANIAQKEIGRHMKVLSDALKLSQPINSNSISVHMPRFCGILQLSKTTQDLATHIGEVVINKSFCTRRNPISISAAAIYLACQLEDKRKTQTEICKATGLTEVTLRKVYKELLENLNDLLPLDYTPAVPPEKAFPVSAAVLGRVCATRAAAVANGEACASTNIYMSGASLTSNGSAVLGASDSNLNGSVSHLSSSVNHVRSATLPTGASMSTPGPSSIRGSTPPSMDGRAPIHLFAIPPSSCATGGPGMESLEQTRLAEATIQEFVEREKERDRFAESDPGNPYGGLKISPGAKVNLSTAVSSGSGSSIRPPYFPYPSIDPRLLEMWQMHPPYGLTTVDGSAVRGFDRSRDDVTSQAGAAPKAGSQFLSLVPGVGDPGNISALPAAVQLKIFQLANPRGADAASREREQSQLQKHNVGFDRDIIMLENEVEKPSKAARLDNDHSQVPGTSSSRLSTFPAAAAVRSTVKSNVPTGIWSFGDFPSKLHSVIPQGGHKGNESFGVSHMTAVRDKMSNPSGQDQSQQWIHRPSAGTVGSELARTLPLLNVCEATSAETPSVSAHAFAPPSVNAGAELESLNVTQTASGAAKGDSITNGVGSDGAKGEDQLHRMTSAATVDAGPAVVDNVILSSNGTSLVEADTLHASREQEIIGSSGSVSGGIQGGEPQHMGEEIEAQAVPLALKTNSSNVTHVPGSYSIPEGDHNAGCL